MKPEEEKCLKALEWWLAQVRDGGTDNEIMHHGADNAILELLKVAYPKVAEVYEELKAEFWYA